MKKETLTTLEKEFIDLAVNISGFLKNHFPLLYLNKDELEMRVEFEEFLTVPNVIPQVVLGKISKDKLDFATVNDISKSISKTFGFREKILSISESPFETIQNYNITNEYKENRLFLLELIEDNEVLEIRLSVNTVFKQLEPNELKKVSSENNTIKELMGETIIDKILTTSRYSDELEELYNKFPNADIIDINKVFTNEKMLKNLAKRAISISKHNFKGSYDSVEERNIIYRFVHACYTEFINDEELELKYSLSLLEVDHMLIPVILVRNSLGKLIAVYNAVFKLDGIECKVRLLELYTDKNKDNSFFVDELREKSKCIFIK